jgi:hypothetical protein
LYDRNDKFRYLITDVLRNVEGLDRYRSILTFNESFNSTYKPYSDRTVLGNIEYDESTYADEISIVDQIADDMMTTPEWSELFGLTFYELMDTSYGVYELLRLKVEEYKRLKERAIELQKQKAKREEMNNDQHSSTFKF